MSFILDGWKIDFQDRKSGIVSFDVQPSKTEPILIGLTGLTGGFRLLSSSIDLSNPRWNDCAYGELKSSLSKNWVGIGLVRGFKINVEKRRIRHITTLKLKIEDDEIQIRSRLSRIRLFPTLISKIKWLVALLPLRNLLRFACCLMFLSCVYNSFSVNPTNRATSA